jgi:hypothetical protein
MQQVRLLKELKIRHQCFHLMKERNKSKENICLDHFMELLDTLLLMIKIWQNGINFY